MDYKPIPGSRIFSAVRDKKMIIMAANTRMDIGCVRGIFRAAKELNSAIIFELARSESDLSGGYTGITPALYAEITMKAAREVGHDIWALHADHIGVKEGTREEIDSTKKLIMGQIDAGYTSFAIDPSHLFNFDGKTVLEELRQNLDATEELAKFIEENVNGEFGLEVEVGEIGREDKKGRILTTPEEAVTFISELNRRGVYPQVLAIANGSSHGNTYDKNGKLIPQVSIDIEQTIRVAKALEENNLNVRIAQHGITGTPIELIRDKFPKGHIIKGNVATYWQNMVWDILREHEPELFKKIWDWTLEKYRDEGKSEDEVFGKFSKKAIKPHADEINAVSQATKRIVEERAYAEAKEFMKAFGSEGSADIVREEFGR
ncbi:MAG: class II fructose-bisphosphate aldolase [archaeon]